jgi:hypothetical protein
MKILMPINTTTIRVNQMYNLTLDIYLTHLAEGMKQHSAASVKGGICNRSEALV